MKVVDNVTEEMLEQQENDVMIVEQPTGIRGFVSNHPVATGVIAGAVAVGAGLLVYNLLSDDDEDDDDDDVIDAVTFTEV